MCHQQQQPHQTLHSRQALYYMHGEKGCGSDTLLSTGVHDPMCAYIHTTKAPLLAPLSNNKLHRTCYEPRNMYIWILFTIELCVSVHFHYLEVWEGRKQGGREGGREFCLVLLCTGTPFVRNCRAQSGPVGESGTPRLSLYFVCNYWQMVVFLYTSA